MTCNFALINRLAPLAKAGDKWAEEDLLRECYRLVEWVQIRHGWHLRVGADDDDLRQAGVMKVARALRTWDPRRFDSFAHFAVWAAERGMTQELRWAHRQKYTLLNEALSLNAPVLFDGRHEYVGEHMDHMQAVSGMVQDPAEVATSEEMALLSEMSGGLTELEQAAFWLVIMGGFTYVEAAKESGHRSKSLDNAVQRVRRKLSRRAFALANDDRFSAELRAMLVEAAEGVNDPWEWRRWPKRRAKEISA